MNQEYLPIHEYLPHRGHMLLLERVLDIGEGHATCELTLRADSSFCRDGRVPAYVGIEYMAQAGGVLIGARALAANTSPKICYLVSVRKFSSHVDGFDVGTTLTVKAVETLRDDENGVGVMRCSIYHPADVLLVTAQLTAYMPKKLNT
ncbi:MAG: hypothetical protein LBG78_02595 [Azoarcus sp.]|jgi:predicted hotdog family 3-hydroxylacyl-ACP dehydratase|nr:hypothetical protein [Azoarcus sp.]